MNRNTLPTTRSRSRKRRYESSVVIESTTMTDGIASIVDLSIEVTDSSQQSTTELEVIDLTLESPQPTNNVTAFVDLTQCSSSSTHRHSSRLRGNRRSRQRENRPPLNNAISFISDDSDNELEIVALSTINSTTTLNERTEPLNTSSEELLSPPTRKEIVCPVCMESERMIKRRRQLVSTVCGHIFCDVCITNSIKSQHKCPTCRRKLTLKQFHPIFI